MERNMFLEIIKDRLNKGLNTTRTRTNRYVSNKLNLFMKIMLCCKLHIF